MQLEAFVERHLSGFANLPPAWQKEVLFILSGKDSEYSAKARGVGRDAVKAQRKKIFKALQLDDGRALLQLMFDVAVSKLK